MAPRWAADPPPDRRAPEPSSPLRAGFFLAGEWSRQEAGPLAGLRRLHCLQTKFPCHKVYIWAFSGEICEHCGMRVRRQKNFLSLSLYKPLHTGISLRARDTTMSTSTRQPRPSGAPRFRRACRLRHPRGGHRAAADRALPAGPLARHEPARARTRPVRPCRRWMVAPGCDRRLWGVGSARATCRPRLLADQRAPMRPRPRCRPDVARWTPRPTGGLTGGAIGPLGRSCAVGRVRGGACRPAGAP